MHIGHQRQKINLRGGGTKELNKSFESRKFTAVKKYASKWKVFFKATFCHDLGFDACANELRAIF